LLLIHAPPSPCTRRELSHGGRGQAERGGREKGEGGRQARAQCAARAVGAGIWVGDAVGMCMYNLPSFVELFDDGAARITIWRHVCLLVRRMRALSRRTGHTSCLEPDALRSRPLGAGRDGRRAATHSTPMLTERKASAMLSTIPIIIPTTACLPAISPKFWKVFDQKFWKFDNKVKEILLNYLIWDSSRSLIN